FKLSDIRFIDPDTESSDIYTLPLHDALPISCGGERPELPYGGVARCGRFPDLLAQGVELPFGLAACLQGVLFAAAGVPFGGGARSEEHTSELQSRENLVCRLLLAKKNNILSR